jgi:hypothetical protein
MSLRTYFDSALKKDGASKDSAQQRKTALDTTVKKGGQAARHMRLTQESLEKLRANQQRRRKAS